MTKYDNTKFEREHFATYSAEDDKLRIYPAARLPKQEYDLVKVAGFSWAPKQELFFAMWSPGREDLCLAMCGGEINEEDTSMVERAEARSERFDQYSDNAMHRGEQVQKSVEQIMDGIPFGQPILIGHHSQRRAERDAEKIQNGTRRAVMEYKKANYWENRAAGVKAHANYLSQPTVIHRRIKKLQSELRKFKKETAEATTYIKVWQALKTIEGATKIANYDHISIPANDRHPYGSSLWQELDEGALTLEEAVKIAVDAHQRGNAFRERWIEHLEGRIRYENALLDEKGGLSVQRAGKPLEKGGAVLLFGCWVEIGRINKGAEGIVSITLITPEKWRGKTKMSFEHIPSDVMTKEEYIAFKAGGNDPRISIETQSGKAYQPKTNKADHLIEQAKGTTVTAIGGVPDLFATPSDAVEQMIAWAMPLNGKSVLEPEAGSAAILRRLVAQQEFNKPSVIHYCEINVGLASELRKLFPDSMAHYVASDFTEYSARQYDRILMNPPFSNEQDIDHVLHAWELLAPGGILVAIVSEHAFFAKTKKSSEFRRWYFQHEGKDEKLDPTIWKAAGTAVHTRMIRVEKKDRDEFVSLRINDVVTTKVCNDCKRPLNSCYCGDSDYAQ